ncbi:MAG: SH3 domain-containing protein [Clostridium sp.]
MENNTLKVLGTLAAGAAIAASVQTVALADPGDSSTLTSRSATTGTVTADVLNVRANPNTSSSIIGTLKQNTKVSIIEMSSGWYKVSYNNSTGWVSGDYVKLDSAGAVTSTGTVNADALNVRAGASTSNKIIGSLNSGAKVEILSTSNGWHQIKFNGGTGYVSADYITTSSTSTPTPPPSDSGSSNNGSTVINTGTVNADVLNVRSGASTSNGIVGTLRSGSKVEIIETSNGWHKIKYNNTYGYVSADYIEIDSSSSETPDPDQPSHGVNGKVAIVTADALNIRSGAGTNYSIISTARYGSKLPIISYTTGWYKVQVGSTTGYVSESYVTVANEGDSTNPLVRETPLVESIYTGANVVAETEKYLGVPYLWGGFTPMGFDCSGLVQYVYKQLGINLERTTYYQVHQGKIVDRNDLRPGDLIFFTTNDADPNDISHVGIYKGNDLFIHAPKPGDVVRISNLNSAYYSNAYYVAKRIIK